MEWSQNPTIQNREWLRQVAEETGQEIPALEIEDPVLYSDLDWVWEGFVYLSGCRGFGVEAIPLPITITDINSYAEYVGLCYYDQRIEFLRYIRAMDDKFLSIWNRRHGKKKKNA